MSCDNEELLSYYYKNSEMETGDVNSLSSLLSIQEVEERIRQLVAENSNLRSNDISAHVWWLIFFAKIILQLYCNHILQMHCSKTTHTWNNCLYHWLSGKKK